MFAKSDYRIDKAKKFALADMPTQVRCAEKDELKEQLQDVVKKIANQQEALYADDRYSLLLVFQAMDAAGKDSTIEHVLTGVNPAGFEIHSFKQPSKEELDHDFLWRTAKHLPQRGRIGVFNRSYYEEVLVVRVHPDYLKYQRLPEHTMQKEKTIWKHRYESICDHEKHLYRNGTIVLKFFLNVSHEEQANRFLKRLNNDDKQWKFSDSDLAERQHWDDYMHAYEEAIKATSTEYAPWYVIPADNKDYMRVQVANIVKETLSNLPLSYPQLDASEDEVEQWKAQLKKG